MTNLNLKENLLSMDLPREELLNNALRLIKDRGESFSEKSERIGNRSSETQKLIDELVDKDELSKKEGEGLHFPIYLDNNATTFIDPEVSYKMVPYICTEYLGLKHFGNPHSRSHKYGWTAEKNVENARKEVASLINARPHRDNFYIWRNRIK